MSSPRTRAAAGLLLSLRIAYGGGLLAVPARLGTPWLGRSARRSPTQVPLQGVGGREVALHAAALRAALSGRPLRPWLAASIAGDLTDIAATVAGRGDLPDGAAVKTLMAAGGSALLTGLLWLAAED